MRSVLITAIVLAVLALGGGTVVGTMRSDTARVVRIVDGDTIVVTVGGRTETVRYIGVDTPESVRPNTPVECFAEEAAAANERLVAGQEVRLVADLDPRDRYGRLLAYVYRRTDGLFVNAELVRGGYARSLAVAPNVAHAAELTRLAVTARRAGTGLWSRC